MEPVGKKFRIGYTFWHGKASLSPYLSTSRAFPRMPTSSHSSPLRSGSISVSLRFALFPQLVRFDCGPREAHSTSIHAKFVSKNFRVRRFSTGCSTMK